MLKKRNGKETHLLTKIIKKMKVKELCKDGLPCDNPNGDHCRCTKKQLSDYRKRKALRKKQLKNKNK
jgi:hypothetical protein